MVAQAQEVAGDEPGEGAGTAGAPPRLRDGIELLGEYQGSGFKEAPYLVRRPDGQIIQLPPLLYSVAARLDGRRDREQIASEVSEEFDRGLDPGAVEYLVKEKLQPLGLLPAGEESASPEVEAPDPLLAL